MASADKEPLINILKFSKNYEKEGILINKFLMLGLFWKRNFPDIGQIKDSQPG